jgi:hypothetical protein
VPLGSARARATTQRHAVDNLPGLILTQAETGPNLFVEAISLIVWAAQHSQ